jgi:peptide/nickel transport system substrate-binding protein
VRQAVYQAIDEETIVDEVMSGLAIPAGIILEPGIVGYAPELDTRLPSTPMPPRHCSPRPATRTASP